jgi:hypothetical protein
VTLTNNRRHGPRDMRHPCRFRGIDSHVIRCKGDALLSLEKRVVYSGESFHVCHLLVNGIEFLEVVKAGISTTPIKSCPPLQHRALLYTQSNGTKPLLNSEESSLHESRRRKRQAIKYHDRPNPEIHP